MTMTSIAADIVLLPERNIRDLSIKMNQRLREQDPQPKITLDETCIPHVSLMMGSIQEKDLPEIRSKIERITQQYPPGDLQLTSLDIETLRTKEEVTRYTIKNTPRLQRLRTRIIQETEPYFNEETRRDMFINPEEIDDTTLTIIRNYARRAKQKPEDFDPHITLGFGRIKKTPPTPQLPIIFKAESIAVYQLGNCSTCRKELLKHKLT